MTNEYAEIWSAVAASFSAIAALTIMYINRRNMIDSATPEIVINGWNRELKKIGDKEYDCLTFSKILNAGRGTAFHLYINATNIKNNLPLTFSSTEHISIIPSGKEVDIEGEITLVWKNVNEHRLLPIEISIYSLSSKAYRYHTIYRLLAVESNKNHILVGGSIVAPGIMLTQRNTISQPMWKLKVNGYLARLPAIGRLFKDNNN